MKAKDFPKLDDDESVPFCDLILETLNNRLKQFMEINETCMKMYKRARRHSVHLDECFSKNSQPKGLSNSKINRFLKIQNIILSRIDLYRAQAYINQSEVNFLERKRRKSWAPGDEGVQYLSLMLRQNVLQSDIEILNRNVQNTASEVSSKSFRGNIWSIGKAQKSSVVGTYRKYGRMSRGESTRSIFRPNSNSLKQQTHHGPVRKKTSKEFKFLRKFSDEDLTDSKRYF